MPDKPTDGSDTSLTKSPPESEQQEATEQETPGASLPAPQQFVEQFEQIIAGGIGPVRNPVLEKVTEEHITKVIELTGEDSKADRRYKMAYTVLGAIFGLIVFLVLTYHILPLDKELYKQLLQGLAVFVGGLGTGYGVQRWRDSRRSS